MKGISLKELCDALDAKQSDLTTTKDRTPYEVLKKAYIKQVFKFHPDKATGSATEKAAAEEKTKEIVGAWTKANTEGVIETNGVELRFPSSPSLPESKLVGKKLDPQAKREYVQKTFGPKDTSTLAQAVDFHTSNYLEIYFTVSLTDKDKLTPSGIEFRSTQGVVLVSEKQVKNIKAGVYLNQIGPDLIKQVAASLKKNSRKGFMVGLSEAEAVEISNYKGHSTGKLLVGYRVKVTDLTDAKLSQSDLGGEDLLSAKGGEHFCLKPEFSVQEENIILIRPMASKEILNSMRGTHGHDMSLIPSNYHITRDTQGNLIMQSGAVTLISSSTVDVGALKRIYRENATVALFSAPKIFADGRTPEDIVAALHQRAGEDSTGASASTLRQSQLVLHEGGLAISNVPSLK